MFNSLSPYYIHLEFPKTLRIPALRFMDITNTVLFHFKPL